MAIVQGISADAVGIAVTGIVVFVALTAAIIIPA
tara:strand:- start:316 stop:417 length:102 start_codon:yes stop_codon:yes gene_type:complete